jgi:prepilin-type processing-associated H-X9-DG protein
MPFSRENDLKDALPRIEKPPSIGLWMLFGVPGLLILSVAIAYLWILPDLNSGKSSLQTQTCLTNLGELARATNLYAADFDDHIPSKAWNSALTPYLHDRPDYELMFACPVQRRMDPESSGYALNSAVAGKQMKSIGTPNTTILIFDSEPTNPGAIASTDQMASPGRHEHGRVNNVVFVDGNVKSIRK